MKRIALLALAAGSLALPVARAQEARPSTPSAAPAATNLPAKQSGGDPVFYQMDPVLAKRYGLVPPPPQPTPPPAPGGSSPPPPPTPAIPPGNPDLEDWDALLAQGIWEEEVNGQLEKAIEVYSQALVNYDQRRLAAGRAMFRLAEGYRKLGYHEEARVLYGRVMREFADQPELVEASQGHLRVTPGAMAARRVTRSAPSGAAGAGGGMGFGWIPNSPLIPVPDAGTGGGGGAAEAASGGAGMAVGVGGGRSFDWWIGGGDEIAEPRLPAEVVARLKEMDKTTRRNALSAVHPDPLLRQLIQGLMEAERELKERSTELGAEHPSQQKTAALIEALNQQIDSRAEAILTGMELMASARAAEPGAVGTTGAAHGEQRRILARQLELQKLRLEEVKKRREAGAASSEQIWEAEMRVLDVERELARLPAPRDLPQLPGIGGETDGGQAGAGAAAPTEAPGGLGATAPNPPANPPMDRLARLRISELEESIAAHQRALREVETELEQTAGLLGMIQTTPAERLPLDLVKDSRFLLLRSAYDAARRALQGGAEGPDRAAVEMAHSKAHDQLKFWVDNDYRGELEKKIEFLEQRRQLLGVKRDEALKRMEEEAKRSRAP